MLFLKSQKQKEIEMLEERLRTLKAKGEVRKKIGFKEGLKRSIKIFGKSAGATFKALGEANQRIEGDNVDDVIGRLPS